MTTTVNGIYVLQGITPSQIAGAPVGVKVVDIYDDNGVLFSAAQVAQMKSSGGAVLGYFSIGEAENYRSYWSTLPSSIIGPQDPAWPGDYQVAYWTPQWLAASKAAIQTMIAQGYTGAYFDVVNEAEQAWAISHVPGGTLADAESAMVTLIQELSTYAHTLNRNFQIWINSSGAEDMLANSTLDKTINGAYEEQLFYQTATTASASADLSSNLAYLEDLVKAGKPVVAIEYVSGASQIASVEAQAKADGLGYYIANPNLALDGVDVGIFQADREDQQRRRPDQFRCGNHRGDGRPRRRRVDGGHLDGKTQIGSAKVAANGSWSAKVTLANEGANVLTATDVNDAGTGTSNAVTYTLATPPTLTIANASLTVTGSGGTVALGLSVTAPAASAATTVTIAGLPAYELITDKLDGKSFAGTSITLTAAEVDSGLTLKSTYTGTGHPTATLTITAKDTIAGVTSVSAAKTLTVIDRRPPRSASLGPRPSSFRSQSIAGAAWGSQEKGAHRTLTVWSRRLRTGPSWRTFQTPRLSGQVRAILSFRLWTIRRFRTSRRHARGRYAGSGREALDAAGRPPPSEFPEVPERPKPDPRVRRFCELRNATAS